MGSAARIFLQLMVVAMLTFLIHDAEGRSKKPQCTVCKGISDKFEEGLKNTAKSNFGGGNTRWEEKSLGSYQFSETRLIEITEQLCSDNDCHNFIEQYEEDIENWWFKRFAKGKDENFHDYFCIAFTQACCPKNTYGSDCKTCPGGTERPCKGNGNCDGEGTREGTGKCNCDTGYMGDLCDECAEGYYGDSIDDSPTVCTACHDACDGGCDKEGPGGCHECKKGWKQDEDNVCQDVNECEEDEENKLCDASRFCRNTEGKYECEGCDSACEGCTGFGPAKCKECKENYYKDGEQCKACDKSCKSSCSGPGRNACDECRDGYELKEDDSCQDINECEKEPSPCEENQTCQNTQGSYHCNNCHKACHGCTGTSKEECKECAPGYEKNEDSKACEDKDECLSEGKICKGEHEKCVNYVGGYECACMKSYVRRGGKCERKQKAAVTYSKPACEICKEIIKGVEQGIEKTNKQNFGGGNTQWEEKKLGVYAYSETRFVEVTEDVCTESDKDCNKMMENNEKFLEQWWFSHFAKQKETDLLNYFCINRVEACCPNGTYGTSCAECPGGKDKPCSGNGDCSGDETREGTGKCECRDAYTGTTCNACATGHFQVTPDVSPIVCEACDESCDESCTATGPKGCDSCKKGWKETEGEGCTDLNECDEDPERCTGENTYCENSIGSFSCQSCSSACKGCTGAGNDKCAECAEGYFSEDDKCLECHSACDGCTGPGANSCVQCSSGWTLVDDTCTDINECQTETPPCGDDQYCVNNLGSYRCHGCHSACKGCTAPGPDNCKECGDGYQSESGDEDDASGTEGGKFKCADVDECATGTVCLDEGEVCSNSVGSYKCTCADKYTKKDGKCIKQKDKNIPKSDIKVKTKQASKKTNPQGSKPKIQVTPRAAAGKKKAKSKKKDLSSEHMKYVASLIGFGLVGYMLRKSWLAQLVFTSTFWVYLYWFSMRFEPSRKHTLNLEL